MSGQTRKARPPRVLLVEDQEEICLELRTLLEASALQVVVAGNGRMALKQLSERAFDLVLTDIFMDEMDGIELLQRLRKQFPSLPVVAMSGRRSVDLPQLRFIACSLGAVDFLPKPVSGPLLLQRIATLLDDSGSAASSPELARGGQQSEPQE
jgi:CheY-like chemotaxis protein